MPMIINIRDCGNLTRKRTCIGADKSVCSSESCWTDVTHCCMPHSERNNLKRGECVGYDKNFQAHCFFLIWNILVK